MRPLLLAALLAAVPASAVALVPSDIEAPILVNRVDCHIVIDTTGRIVEYTPRTELRAEVAERVRELVLSLRFEPVEVDGRIVNAATDMRVSVAATKLDDGRMRLAVDNLTFPNAQPTAHAAFEASRGGHRVTPMYPREALYWGANADVLAVLHFGADGRVIDAAVQQSALVHGRARPADTARVLAVFERATLQALRQWKVDPASMPAESRVGDGFIGYIPVNFRLAGRHDDAPAIVPGAWTLETRTTKRVPAWVPVAEHAPQPGVSDLADGEMGSANRRFRLAEPLASGT